MPPVRRASTRAAAASPATASPAPGPSVQPKQRGRPRLSSTSTKTADTIAADLLEAQNVQAAAPEKKTRKRKAAAPASTEVENLPPAVQEGGEPAPAKPRRGKAKAAAANVKEAAEDEADEDEEPVRLDKNGRRIGKRRKKVVEPKVYVIPDVPRRDFRLEGPERLREERKDGYKGRLGYACLNTVLRGQDPPVFCSRNVRIKTIEEKGLDWVKGLAKQNAKDIIPMLEWNAANRIHFMRLSSEIFPFASHSVHGYDPAIAAEELKAAGEVARRLGQRLTMHPGQFCQLGTPNPQVLEASIRELEVHARVLDLMGMGPDSVMILHGGGTYGDREATIERIYQTVTSRLSPSARSRLVLENDEMSYSAMELLPLCQRLDVPLVYDFHHGALRPSERTEAEMMPDILAIWRKRGIKPKFHLSEPRPGARSLKDRRAHSDRIARMPDELPFDADLMLECKDKEQAVLEMYRIYGFEEVKHESLRPPADDLTTATSGRRSKLDGSGGGGGGADKKDEGGTTEWAKSQRAIRKMMAIAEKRGMEYKGPLLDEHKRANAAALMSGEEVLQEMKVRMREIEEVLRNGGERPPYERDAKPGKTADGAKEVEPNLEDGA